MKIDLSNEIERVRNQTVADGAGEEVAKNIEGLRQNLDKYYASQETQRAKNEAESEVYRKKQLRHDWWVALISAVVGVILTLIIEHFSDIIDFIESLFQLA